MYSSFKIKYWVLFAFGCAFFSMYTNAPPDRILYQESVSVRVYDCMPLEKSVLDLKNIYSESEPTFSILDTVETDPEPERNDTTSNDRLEEFRSAFESLIEEQRSKEQEEIQAEAEQQIFIELDGLVMDETRSKIGRDFYDIFFRQWEAPPNSNNFSIKISEQPTPSLGSIVSVSVNDEQIFQYRLQPRYEVIEQVANYAVRFTYNYMLENKHQYKIY